MANSLRTNLDNVSVRFLKALKVQVTATTVKDRIQSHPDYPSLYSLSDMLEKLHVENAAYEMEEEKLAELTPPFVAYLHLPTGGDFVLVTAKTADTISYQTDSSKVTTEPHKTFNEKWNKVVLLAEPDAQSGEDKYQEQLAKEKKETLRGQLLKLSLASVIVLLLAVLLGGFDAAEIGSSSLLYLTKLLGVTFTGLLLVLEVDKTNAFVKNICSAGKQTNCDAVINSKAGKIFGISWGEAGFFYFASTLLFALLPGIPIALKTPWIAVFATLSAPYILFSLYYQYKVVKQWCPLCLAVQAVLALELVWSIVFFWAADVKLWEAMSDWHMIALVVVCVLAPLTAWYWVKPSLIKAKAESQYRYSYKRLMYNPEYFNHLLSQQPQAPDGWQSLGITIGNPAAPNTIVKVCNPYCGPCANAHPILEEIVKHNDQVKLKVIFTATNSPDDIKAPPVKHLLAIEAKGDRAVTQKALDDWYMAEKKDYDSFAAKYPMNGELEEQKSKLDAMDQWCKDAEIAFTPTIFINGQKIPENYNIEELKHVL